MATGRIGTTPVLTTRWSKAPAAGTTSLSGLDDNSVSLVYSVGYEAVYRNGTLLSRGNDYTATNGTSITLIDATLAGDIIEVFANQTIPLTDTYSQTVSDGRFIRNTLTTTTGDIIYASAANTPARLGIGSTGQVLTVSGGIPAWGAAPAASFIGCAVYKSADQSISHNVSTAVTFDSEYFDTDAFHSTSSNTSRITIPSGKAGKYLITWVLGMQGSGGIIELRMNKNGSLWDYICNQTNSSLLNPRFSGALIMNLAVGDYLELFVYQSSGSAINCNTSTQMQVAYLGA